MAGDGRAGFCMGYGATKEECADGEIDEEDVRCVKEHAEKDLELVYDICALQDMSGSQQRNGRAEYIIRVMYDKNFEISKFREIARSFEDCENLLSRETENRV